MFQARDVTRLDRVQRGENRLERKESGTPALLDLRNSRSRGFCRRTTHLSGYPAQQSEAEVEVGSRIGVGALLRIQWPVLAGLIQRPVKFLVTYQRWAALCFITLGVPHAMKMLTYFAP